MCGIAGIASVDAVPDRSLVAAACAALRHRGPDGSGEWWSADGRAGLGHRRLAIIDLSHEADQPMLDAARELAIVFNGEIYNFVELKVELAAKGHRFRTASDTEVLLAAYREWGTGCLGRLNGMFAFALYDTRARTLFMARDRAGEKPLFYAATGRTLHFASELKGLMADSRLPRRISPVALDAYLGMGFVPGELCILEGVKKLRPAHALQFNCDTGELRVWRYWQLPPDASASAEESQLLEQLETLLADAVKRQLVADVPLGVLLSGGVDSSLITAMAARARSNVKTFTIRFPGHGVYDETTHARLIARHFATDHVELDAAECTTDLLPLLARQFDEPLVDSSMLPTYLVSRLVRAHCTVTLGGDGGDELFGGYMHYDRLLWMQRNLGWVPLPLRAGIACAAERLLPVGFKGRNWLQGLGADLRRGLPLIASYFDRNSRRRLMARRSDWPLVAETLRREAIPHAEGLLERATRMDFEQYLPEDILTKVDRASMLNSLEVRAPMLDYRLVEFAFSRVPPGLKATPGERKVLLKKLALRVLPEGFDRERKQGFSIPLAAWLQSPDWHGYFRDVLLAQDGIFDPSMVRELLDGQQRGRANSERLFALVMFELWRREYRASI